MKRVGMNDDDTPVCEIEPINDKIIVVADKDESQTRGGIYLPDNSKRKTYSGVVVAVGPGRLLTDSIKTGEQIPRIVRGPMDVCVGDRVYYARYAGNIIEIDEKEYLVMTQDDLLGRRKREDNERA
jgi:chaperonin GroES